MHCYIQKNEMKPCSRANLDETEWSLQDSLHSVDLRMIQLRQAWGWEPFRQRALEHNVLHIMTQQLVVDVAPHRWVVHSKRFQGWLHPADKQWGCPANISKSYLLAGCPKRP